jgi:hypothetical protein
VLIDAETGQISAIKNLPWYLRAIEISRPFHFGDYGGLPLKTIWALFDVALIVILISGVYLCLSRRKTPIEASLILSPVVTQTMPMTRIFCGSSAAYGRGACPRQAVWSNRFTQTAIPAQRPVQTGASHAIGLSGEPPGASPPPAFHTRTKKYLLIESVMVGDQLTL